jgi:hypothetical protein
MCLIIVIGLTLGSFLTLTQMQRKSVVRSQVWNDSIVKAEAGIEDGFGLLNKYVEVQKTADWSTYYSEDGWANSGNVFSLTRYLDASHQVGYTVNITNLAYAPVIASSGFAKGPLGMILSRKVVVQTKIDALFNVCMATLGNIDLKGNGIATDSFDSSNPSYSTNGTYTALRRKAGGDIVTNDALTNSSISIGNANIAGKVTTGPSGIITIGPNGTVGDLSWVASSLGIMPGWSGSDLNVVFKQIQLPDTSWMPANSGGAGAGSIGAVLSPIPGNPANSQTYDHYYTHSGDYYINDSGTIYIGTNTSVRLWIKAATFNPNYIYVAGTGTSSGKLICYMDGSSAVLGTDDRTQSGLSKNIAFFGTTNLTSLSYKGNGDFTGVIYAPNANFQLSGGGSGVLDFIGASVSKTVQMNGHYHFHYDEALRNSEWNNGYVATQWVEN